MNAPFLRARETVGLTDLRDPGERARIDGFVAQQNGSVFHRPDWIVAVECGTGQRALGLVAEQDGQVTGWLPLTLVHSPLFGRALVSSGFGVGGGPLARDATTLSALLTSAQELALRSGCADIELRSDVQAPDWRRVTESHANFARDLAPDDDAELLAVPRKHRAEIRKGLKNDLHITTGQDEADRAAHYGIYAASVHALGTPVFPRALFDAMLDMFGKDADILTVRHDGEAVASVLSFYHGGAVIPFWGGGTFAARGLRANERMYFELMRHARERGCTRFDFGRSKTGSGPYRYKKNWGFTPEPLAYARWTAPGHEARDIDPTSDAYAAKIALWKKLPLRVANAIGPHIAKGLA